ncbi:hypothetical protein [Streptomyces sp. SID12488]|uniref:hypothetical protein n=1 Tax=Streptomyces sp. SID12488 TaxID=2706040 RepID=UPI0013DB0783|nr:hypothetical protein [Streptomyces sp. SID12488]NEA61329.1 hypothetical protein [Streptomyces sp. SID12488]
MTTRDAETLAQLVSEQAGKGKRYTFEQLANRSVDPESHYSPSANLVWTIASGKSVKMNPKLVKALAAGLGLTPERVADAAHRQFLGWYSSEPSAQVTGAEEDEDVVYRVAAKAGVTAEEMPAVKAFYAALRGEGK